MMILCVISIVHNWRILSVGLEIWGYTRTRHGWIIWNGLGQDGTGLNTGRLCIADKSKKGLERDENQKERTR